MSTAARAGSKGTCLLGAMAFGHRTKRSRKLSTRCSRSTRNGSRSARKFPWRRPIASLNVFLSSHAWRNDHNGFSHQAPGFVDNALARRSEVIRIYYPPDSNCLLSVFDHCLRSRNYVNIVTCGKQPELQWLNMDQAPRTLLARRVHMGFRFERQGRRAGRYPGVRGRCADASRLVRPRGCFKNMSTVVKVRVVNVVDLERAHVSEAIIRTGWMIFPSRRCSQRTFR